MFNILIALVLGLCAFISPIISSADDINSNTAKSSIITLPSGTTNEYNPFRYLNNMPVYWGSNDWSLLFNYNANPNSLNWLYNGISVGSAKWVFDTGPEYEGLILDFNFSQKVQVSGINNFIVTLDSRSVSNRSAESFYIRYTTDWSNMYPTTYDVKLDGNSLHIIFTGQFVFTGLRIQNIEYSNSNTSRYDFFKSATYGSTAGQDVYQSGYYNGYDSGYDVGYGAGYDSASGVIDINSASYQAGYNQGSEDSSNLFELFSSAVSAPVNVLMDTFNFEILGVNVSTFILSLLTLGFIVIIIRLLI